MQRLLSANRGRMATIVLLFTVATMLMVSAIWAAVTLENFEGRWEGNYATLQFSTGSEIDHAGFHVWRSELNLAPDEVNSETATRITTSLIVGNPCQAMGYEYEFEDRTVDPTEDIYYYYLESQGCAGSTPEFFGDMTNGGGLQVVHTNAPEFENKVYAPLIGRDSLSPIPTPMPMPTVTPTPLIWPTSTPNPTE